MSIEDYDELAQEFAEFGYRETFDPNDADRRNFYKVEKWDAAGLHSYTPPSTWNVQERSSPVIRTADRAVAIRYAKASAS